MNYEKILSNIKAKIDRRMEKNPPESQFFEKESVNPNGEYDPLLLDTDSVASWTRSFLNGAVAYLYYHYREEKYLEYLKKTVPVYEKYIYNHLREGHHDDGFRFSLALVSLYKLNGDENLRRLTLVGADTLAKRFLPTVGIITGFFGKFGEKRAQTIADDMMNIALLMWAGEETGNAFYKYAYISHIDTILANIKRPDYSYRHSFQWDASTGKPLGELNYCGYSVGSTWSRGQAWVLYGLVNALEVTQDEGRYLPEINGTLNMLLSNLREYPIPKWDLSELAKDVKLFDTSAAAIIVSALLKLKTIPVQGSMGGLAFYYQEKTEEIINCLVNDFFAPPNKDNILEGGQIGTRMCGCVWGDYFMVELLMRKLYREKNPDFWI